MNDTIVTNKNVVRGAVALLAVGALFMAVLTINELRFPEGESVRPQNTIAVTGEGEVVSIPDTATFTFSVVESATEVSAAQKKATDKMKKVMDYLEGKGIAERDIKTVGYNIYPKYEFEDKSALCNQWGCPPSGNQKIVGYEVSQSVEIKVRKLEEAGDLLSGVGNLSVSNISGLNFTVDDDEALIDEARSNAIADAREKAEVLADELGVRLVRVVSFNEGGNYYPMKYEAYGRGGADTVVSNAPAVPVTPGENTYMVNVTVVYEIR